MVDLDSGETVFEITAENFDDRKGVKRMSEIQSTQGFPIRRDGRYELVAKYNNSTSEEIDAMAILYFYVLDEDPSGTIRPDGQ